MTEAAKRGGTREGAGRKPTAPHMVRVAVPLRLPAWLVQWIDSQPGTRAAAIEAALIKAHKLIPPDEKKPHQAQSPVG